MFYIVNFTNGNTVVDILDISPCYGLMVCFILLTLQMGTLLLTFLTSLPAMVSWYVWWTLFGFLLMFLLYIIVILYVIIMLYVIIISCYY